MTTPRLVAFDLDDTLAASKSAIEPRIAALLLALAERVEVAIISGGNEEQFRTQVVSRLGDAGAATLQRIHLLPTCGTRYLRHDGNGFAVVYARDLSTEQKDAALASLEEEARRLGLWESETWGPILEDRGSQITFSALGQRAPHDAKKAWDPDGSRRAALRDAVALRVPDLEVRSGGSTSKAAAPRTCASRSPRSRPAASGARRSSGCARGPSVGVAGSRSTAPTR